MKIPPWSASSIDAFCTCPFKYYHLRVIKDVKDLPPSDQVLYGRKLHTAFEDAVNLGSALPLDCSHWQKLVDQLKQLPGEKFPELKFGVDRNFNPTGYFDPNTWSRGAADLVVLHGKEAVIIDYKTGKWKESDQLALYAAYAFAKWPFLEKITTMFIWLKAKKIDKAEYTRADKEELWQRWLPKTKRLEIAYEKDQWEKRPSGLCKAWCPLKGQCEYCGL